MRAAEGALYDVKRAGKTPGPLDRRGQGDGWIGADGPAGDRGRVPHWSHPGHPTANALRYANCCAAGLHIEGGVLHTN